MKRLLWLGSSKKDLRAMPDDVQDTFGYALHLAQVEKKHEQTKPLKGFGSAGVLEVVEDSGGGTFRAVHTVKFGEVVYVLFSEEIDAWDCDTQARHGLDSGTIESSRSTRQRRNEMIEIEESSGNVYADSGMADADEMIVKAHFATKIGKIIKGRKWSQQQAADVLGLTQPKLSRMLRGQFRGISEAKMLDCLVRLGRDAQIVVGPARHATSIGHVDVVFTA
jgi:predicted XRE-type DNA-binding protein